MSAKLLNGHHLEFLGLKGAAQSCLYLHMSKCHIVRNHMSRLIYLYGPIVRPLLPKVFRQICHDSMEQSELVLNSLV